jgi:hypothetical protein
MCGWIWVLHMTMLRWNRRRCSWCEPLCCKATHGRQVVSGRHPRLINIWSFLSTSTVGYCGLVGLLRSICRNCLWWFGRLYRLRNCRKEIAFRIVSFLGRIFSELSTSIGRRLWQVVPNLIRLRKINLDLFFVCDRMKLEFGPCATFDKRIVFLRLSVMKSLGLQLLLGLL